MATTEKTETLTIRISEELKEKIKQCAERERRTPAGLVALWVEDVATVEHKKNTKAATYERGRA